MFEFATVASIVVVCYFIGELAKRTPIDNKWIPVICGGFGLILGIVGMYTIPDFPANDIIGAMAVGISSGMGATGAHQIYKQLRENGGADA